MAKRTAGSRLAGRIGSLFALAGIVIFMAGLFGAPRVLVFVGIGLIAVSLVAYYIEELGDRRAAA